jgi:hypothetical protein
MKRASLLGEHLEKVSWHILQEYPAVIRQLIHGRHGIYALYKKDRLYYVGLATNLRTRLKSHLRDRHDGAWDRFSVYLTLRSDHIGELEGLLIRIAEPHGNRASGRFTGSKDLFRPLHKRLKEIDADRRATLLGGSVAARRRTLKARRAKGRAALAGFADRRIPLQARYKGKTHKATLRRDGRIRVGRKLFDSPGAAARAIAPGIRRGWHFWRFRDPDGKWVRLETVKG